MGNRRCFYYHIGKCPGVCIGKISLEDYRQNFIGKLVKFLAGRQGEVLKDLQAQMKAYAAAKKFEKAAKARDQIFALNRILERQKLVYPRKIDQDVFSLYPHTTAQFGVRVYRDSAAAINLFVIREGKLIRKENFILENTKGATAAEILEEFLPKYYLEAMSWPKEILLPVEINAAVVSPFMGSKAEIEEHVAEVFRLPSQAVVSRFNDSLRLKNQLTTNGNLKVSATRPPRIFLPIRGPKLKLIQLGTENAKQYLESQSDKKLLEEARLLSALKELQRVLNLHKLPARIEAFDISNIQGTNPTGSMVVFDYARPKKEDYRKFKINRKQTPDDYAMMREMLERRFSHFEAEGREIAPGRDLSLRSRWSQLPDLILVDGGKGQLAVTVKVQKKYKLNIPVISLAKRLEEIFLPGKKNPLVLPKNSIALFLLQRIRDEAHRFAIGYHRKLRTKSMASSALDQIPGIGAGKKKKLLQTFGSITKIRGANLTELANIVGKKSAQVIKASF